MGTCEEGGVVDALCAGDDLLAADEDIKGVAVARVLRVWHRVERPHLIACQVSNARSQHVDRALVT